jgi:hypothetical protein
MLDPPDSGAGPKPGRRDESCRPRSEYVAMRRNTIPVRVVSLERDDRAKAA